MLHFMTYMNSCLWNHTWNQGANVPDGHPDGVNWLSRARGPGAGCGNLGVLGLTAYTLALRRAKSEVGTFCILADSVLILSTTQPISMWSHRKNDTQSYGDQYQGNIWFFNRKVDVIYQVISNKLFKLPFLVLGDVIVANWSIEERDSVIQTMTPTERNCWPSKSLTISVYLSMGLTILLSEYQGSLWADLSTSSWHNFKSPISR